MARRWASAFSMHSSKSRCTHLLFKVVGGQAASDGNWPFIASVGVNTEYVCTASIIGKTYVLTAAHCVDSPEHPAPEIIDPSAFWVVLGTFNPVVPLVIRVKRIVTARYWNLSSWPNVWTDDVALLELAEAIQSTTTRSRFVCQNRSEAVPETRRTSSDGEHRTVR